MSLIENESYIGETRRVGSYEITPVNQVIKIQVPGKHAGFIWNRPRSVVVTGDDGQEQVLPVVDVTRIAMWAMLAGGILGALAVGLMRRQK